MTEAQIEHDLQRGCLERLSNASARGLAEPILIASLQHRFRDELGVIAPNQVRRALRGLQERGQVVRSAGRWRRLR